eukprot:530189-Lingulodinium_polyedra.AAC.1
MEKSMNCIFPADERLVAKEGQNRGVQALQHARLRGARPLPAQACVPSARVQQVDEQHPGIHPAAQKPPAASTATRSPSSRQRRHGWQRQREDVRGRHTLLPRLQ